MISVLFLFPSFAFTWLGHCSLISVWSLPASQGQVVTCLGHSQTSQVKSHAYWGPGLGSR